MRVLVVGAGVAGLTLAALLARQGRRPTVLERSTVARDGYAIGLYPLGSRVLHGLGRYREFGERGLVLERYEIADQAGRPLRAVDMSVLTGGTGPVVMVRRRSLLDLLGAACAGAQIRRGDTVAGLEQDGRGVRVTFGRGADERFDLVVGCDGMGSTVRDLVFGPQPGFASGWVLLTWWAGPERFSGPVAREWWGHDRFFGAYPVPGAVMCVAGAPAGALVPTDRAGLGEAPRRLTEPFAGCIAGLAGALSDADGTPDTDGADGTLPVHLWSMRDVRSRAWVDRRVALCGDAAAGFLPTAGVGASAAMRAAAGLADELSRADAATVPLALQLYEKRCRRVVQRNQSESRWLARVMFPRRAVLCPARDQLVRRFPMARAVSGIVASSRTPF
ncbi:MAG TPA: NAD(P)/FAD-dependent oxidoreductase [Mycobacteriales bacterium]|nr:NAD(P)/FAD-dependent oxidoreductase [Mycobacteriales bacterium]